MSILSQVKRKSLSLFTESSTRIPPLTMTNINNFTLFRKKTQTFSIIVED